MKKFHFAFRHCSITALAMAFILFTVSGCQSTGNTPAADSTAASTDSNTNLTDPTNNIEGTDLPGGTSQEAPAGSAGSTSSVFSDETSGGAVTPENTVTKIVLADNDTQVTGDGVFVEGNVIIIEKPGSYAVSGTLTDGQLRIEVSKEDKVEILFQGVTISNSTTAPFYSVSADKTIIKLEAGSVNTLTDAASYTYAAGEDEPNACLFAKDDLTIKGEGTLFVIGNFNNGITSKNDLKITGGTINVTAEKNGIRGNDSITIQGGNITITCGKDALKVSTEDDPKKGYFLMEDGQIDITAGDDAIQAITSVTVSGGQIRYTASGKQVKCDQDVNITEGLMQKK